MSAGMLLVTAGCGDGSSATPGPTGSPATIAPSTTAPKPPAPDPIPTDRAGEPLVPPQRPKAMGNDDAAGAQAAAEYFVQVAGYAERSQDLTEFTALCDPQSQFCNTVVDQVEADREAGSITVGGSTLLTTSHVYPPGADPFYLVTGLLDRTSFVGYDASGAVLFESSGDDNLDFAVAVERRGEQWIIRGAEAGVVAEP